MRSPRQPADRVMGGLPTATGIAHHLAHLLGRSQATSQRPAPPPTLKGGQRAAKSTSIAARRSQKARSTAPQKSPAAARVQTSTFAHLAPVVFEDMDRSDPASTRRPAVAAKKILLAAAKARAPTGTGAAKPTGLAAKIIAAGKKRRGETA